jgi:3-hydroxyacyl-CoA dehydrogenase
MGFGFPPFRGGVLYHADVVGAATILERLEALERTYGARFAAAPTLKERVSKGVNFHTG